MAWVILTIAMLPLFKLDRVTRRDIRRYNREIRKMQARSDFMQGMRAVYKTQAERRLNRDLSE